MALMEYEWHGRTYRFEESEAPADAVLVVHKASRPEVPAPKAQAPANKARTPRNKAVASR